MYSVTSDAERPLAIDTIIKARTTIKVPDAATALLTVKVGAISRTSRKQLMVTTFKFLVSEGLDVFRAKVDSCTEKVLKNDRGELYLRKDLALYMRPGAHSKQAELVEITPLNFASRVARSYKNYLKRKSKEPFQCEVYVFVIKFMVPRRRQLKDLMRSTPTVVQKEFTRSQGVDSFVEVPLGSNKRTRFMCAEDEIHQNLHDAKYYCTVRMMINNAIVPVQLNVQDLLACFASLQQDTTANVLANDSETARADCNGFH